MSSTDLDRAFAVLSPRLNRHRAHLPALAINFGSVALFVLLVIQAFQREGVGAWAVGIVYILYDTSLLAFTARQIRGLRPERAVVPAGVVRPTMTVIVAAHNEARVLGVTIDGLRAQEDAPDVIILADDGSDDDTPGELKRLYGLEAPAQAATTAPGALRWLRLPRGGKARALNAALAFVDTDMVVTVDADTLMGEGALKAMRDAFTADPHLVAATGVLVPTCGPRPMDRLFQWFQRYEYVRNFLSRRAWMNLDSLLLISGAFAGFRTQAVKDVGGFDPQCMVEDYELIHRLHRYSADNGLGWQIDVIGGATAVTDAPATPLAFLRQRRRWFGGFLQTQYWNRDMVGNRRYGRLGTIMLPVKALDTVQPIFGLAAFAILITFLVTGTLMIALPIIAIMIAKVLLDLAFHLWSLRRYEAWTGIGEGLSPGPAILASILEPFTFQLLRHAGAAWGWIAFLTGRETWNRQSRTALTDMAAQQSGTNQ